MSSFIVQEHREWALESRKKSGEKREIENKVFAAQCPECFYTFEPPKFGRPVCPACGYVFPKKERSLDTEEAELQKITGFVLDYDSPEQCRNMQELNAYAKKMGYKKGWAYFQGKQRGFI